MILPEVGKRYGPDDHNEDDVASYDHLVPRSRGGQGGFNMVISHRGCNSKRGQNTPTDEELQRLTVLNERRKYLFTAEHGKISAASFGEITSASIVLAEVLNDLEGEDAYVQRHLVCRFVDLFHRDIRTIDAIEKYDDWHRIVSLVCKHHLERLNSESCQIILKTFVANMMAGMVKTRIDHRRKWG